MSLSITLDVAIGLFGLYLALSLIASALLEFYRALLSRPAHLLRWGIGELFNDPTRVGLAKEFYAHPLIRGLTGGKLPSEIDPKLAARVLVDLMDQGGVLNGATAAPVLASFVRDYDGKKQELMQPISDWFKEGVNRLSGIAARRSQALLLVVGAVMAVTFNVDSIEVARALAINEPLRALAVAEAKHQLERNPQLSDEAETQTPASDEAQPAADETPAADEAQPAADETPAAGEAPSTPAEPPVKPEAARKVLNDRLANLATDYSKLPIGWPDTHCRVLNGDTIAAPGCKPSTAVTSAGGGRIEAHWLGWLLTAIAISLGAQFWYRLLGQLIKLRGGSPAATEKKADEKGED